MARNKSNASKTTPAVRYLRYHLTNSVTPGTETSHYVNLARDLSAINRRLYREGRDYHVKRISVTSSNTIVPPNASAGRFSVSTAPDSWAARGAWNRGFSVWNQMNKDASKNLSGSVQGTWADFKVYLTVDFAAATLLKPLDNGSNEVELNEWAISNFVTPQEDGTGADDFYATLMGDHVGAEDSRTSISLIKSFGESRSTVQAADPSVPSQASLDPLANVFDYGSTVDDVIEYLEGDNDGPPYSIAKYGGGPTNMPKPLVVHETTLGVGGKTVVPSFSALCGQIEFEITSPISEDVYSVLVELAPGKYRGIKADVI